MRSIILSALLLTGCATTATAPTITVDTPVYHPEMPSPYETCNVDWKVLVVGEKPYVALSYDDNIDLALCIKDLERYISETQLITCHYRQELKDTRCKESNEQ